MTILSKEISNLSLKDLNVQLSKCGRDLVTLEEQLSRLLHSLRKIEEEIRQGEQLAVISPGKFDEQLGHLRSDYELALEKKRTLPESIEGLRQLKLMLTTAMQERTLQLDREAQQLCEQQWKGKAEKYVEAARKVVAEAAVAHARSITENPLFYPFPNFIDVVLQPLVIERMFREEVEKETLLAKKQIIKNNPKLG